MSCKAQAKLDRQTDRQKDLKPIIITPVISKTFISFPIKQSEIQSVTVAMLDRHNYKSIHIPHSEF